MSGRSQIRHDSGGFWDEWYATFGNGWVGWLAEAQGRFYMTFYQPLPEGFQLPSFDQIQPGQAIAAGKSSFVVAEKGISTAIAAEGEIPYKFTPNERNYFADLSGQGNTFATIDYGSSPPFLFVGKEVSLAEIGLADAKPVIREAQKVKAEGMGCPNCGGALSLTAPDQAERVVCPFCDSLLDVNQGKLSWLKSLIPSPDAHKFDLKIGAEAAFPNFAEGKRLKIIGAVVRSVTIEGIKYFWHEYLLYNPMIGFRWLVHSDNHWSFVEALNVAEVTGYGNTASYGGKTFKLFQDANAVVEYVTGEFYWRVEQGETVRAIDYIKAPLMISNEITGSEMNWSLSTYLKTSEVEAAFGVSDLPKPFNVAPNQPFEGAFYYTWGLAFLGILMIVGIFMLPLKFPATALKENITLKPLPAQNGSNPVFSTPFELKPRSNIEIEIAAPLQNSWAAFDVDFVNEANNEIESVPLDIEFYQGVEDGESWSEGSTTRSATLSAIEGGKYRLRIDGQWEKWQQPLNISVSVTQNTTGCNFPCALILLLFGPIIGLIRKWMFESSRWSNSMFGGSSSGSDGSSCSSCSGGE